VSSRPRRRHPHDDAPAPAVTPGATPRAQAAPAPNGERVLIPGTVLARQYRGRLIEVTVLPKGFEWEGGCCGRSALGGVLPGSRVSAWLTKDYERLASTLAGMRLVTFAFLMLARRMNWSESA